MQNKDRPLHNGFTLPEIIVSILLLSISAVGTFGSFHFSQTSTNNSLVEFQRLQIQQQLSILDKLELTYPNISAETEFGLLLCLIDQRKDCSLIP